MPERAAGVVVGLVIVAILLLGDVLLGDGVQLASGLLCVPAFVTAAFVGPLRTALVAIASIAAGVAIGVLEGLDPTDTHYLRIAGVAAASAGAVAVASVRVRQSRQLLAIDRIAEAVQRAVLRPLPPRVGPGRLAIRSMSATTGARVGGDFYEAIAFDGRLRLIVGDVRGKGLGAVQLAGTLVGAFRGADHEHLSLLGVLAGLDAAFTRLGNDDEAFATAVLIELDRDGGLTVVNAGHPPPLLMSAAGVRELPPPVPKPPIGLHPEAEPACFRLDHDDRVLVYTDGLIEDRRGSSTFDLLGAASSLRSGGLDDAVNQLGTRWLDYLGGRVGDDVTMLLFQRAG